VTVSGLFITTMKVMVTCIRLSCCNSNGQYGYRTVGRVHLRFGAILHISTSHVW